MFFIGMCTGLLVGSTAGAIMMAICIAGKED